MRAWIIAAGDIDDSRFYRALKIAEEDLVICADGGLDNALLIGINPKVVIGDMDSIQSDIISEYTVVQYPAAKNQTDTQLAIDYAIKQGCREIVLLCSMGGRIDHSLANIMLLKYIFERKAEGMILTHDQRICLITSETVLKRGTGDLVSLIPITDKVEGVFTSGLRYRLANETLIQGDTRGISNEFCEVKANVSIKSGILLAICSN